MVSVKAVGSDWAITLNDQTFTVSKADLIQLRGQIEQVLGSATNAA